jgi:hypothetical protein
MASNESLQGNNIPLADIQHMISKQSGLLRKNITNKCLMEFKKSDCV